MSDIMDDIDYLLAGVQVANMQSVFVEDAPVSTNSQEEAEEENNE